MIFIIRAGLQILADHARLYRTRHSTPGRAVRLGFNQVKWLAGIDFAASYSEAGGGHGGYNPDHEFFGCRQSILLRPAVAGEAFPRSRPLPQRKTR